MDALHDLYLKYKPCIVRITVFTNAGDLHTGTGFHIGDGLIVTARHVMREIVKKPSISGEDEIEVDRRIESISREIDEQVLTVEKVYYHSDNRVDLAVLETNFEAHAFPEKSNTVGVPKMKSAAIPIGAQVDGWISDQFVLCKVLVMG